MNDVTFAAHLAALHNAAFDTQRAWSEAEFHDLLANKHCHAISDPHGFSLIRVIADEAELLTLAVHREKQNRGLGRTLLDQTIAAAATHGATKMFLEVAADNTPAICLYTSSGFATVGKRPQYYARSNAAPVDALVMARALT
jgi:ribosomal-protein-alanine N-acetyltransferase